MHCSSAADPFLLNQRRADRPDLAARSMLCLLPTIWREFAEAGWAHELRHEHQRTPTDMPWRAMPGRILKGPRVAEASSAAGGESRACGQSEHGKCGLAIPSSTIPLIARADEVIE